MDMDINFPAGGPRQPVYSFLQSNGWQMSKWSDKIYSKCGSELSLYGAGSMARIISDDAVVIYDGPLGNIP